MTKHIRNGEKVDFLEMIQKSQDVKLSSWATYLKDKATSTYW